MLAKQPRHWRSARSAAVALSWCAKLGWRRYKRNKMNICRWARDSLSFLLKSIKIEIWNGYSSSFAFKSAHLEKNLFEQLFHNFSHAESRDTEGKHEWNGEQKPSGQKCYMSCIYTLLPARSTKREDWGIFFSFCVETSETELDFYWSLAHDSSKFWRLQFLLTRERCDNGLWLQAALLRWWRRRRRRSSRRGETALAPHWKMFSMLFQTFFKDF